MTVLAMFVSGGKVCAFILCLEYEKNKENDLCFINGSKSYGKTELFQSCENLLCMQ